MATTSQKIADRLLHQNRWLLLLPQVNTGNYLSSTTIDSRLKSPITPLDLISLGIAFALAIFFIFINTPYDYLNYIKSAWGNYDHYYYAYWFLPVFTMLAKLPLWASYILWSVVNITSLFFAVRLFGGKTYFLLLGFQTFYILLYGQITGIIVGALALFTWALSHKRPFLAGFALTIAASKFQLGIPAALFLWLAADKSWRVRFQALFIPCLVALASLIVYPGWPLLLFNSIRSLPPDSKGSISLWTWFGPLALILWLPPLLLPMSRHNRLLSLLAAMPLALPYFQQSDLLLLFSFPVGLASLLCGNLGYLYFLIDWKALQFIISSPMIVYLTITGYAAIQIIYSHKAFVKLKESNNSSIQ